MAIQFLKTGLQTTVQDLGRAGSRHIGIPLSGCFDYLSSMKANAILGKEMNSPVLECAMTGPHFKALKDIEVCISGARINQITIDGVEVDLEMMQWFVEDLREPYLKEIEEARQ